MAILCQPMRPKDVADCVAIVAAHPALATRYGDALNSLRSVWLSLLGREAFRSYVYKDAEGSDSRIVGVGCSAIVSNDFVRDVKTPPFFWIGAELTRRVRGGNSPLLPDKQVREANSNGGVNLVIWEGATHIEYTEHPDLLTSFLGTFGARAPRIGFQSLLPVRSIVEQTQTKNAICKEQCTARKTNARRG